MSKKKRSSFALGAHINSKNSYSSNNMLQTEYNENSKKSLLSKSNSSLEQKLEQLNVSKPIINVILRTIYTLIMILLFALIIILGPIYMVFLVTLLQTIIYKEIINLASQPNKIRNLPWFRAINTYFLLITYYYFYGEKLDDLVFVSNRRILHNNQVYLFLLNHHKLNSFILYCIGFIWFVFNLKKGQYRFQFFMFAFTHMTLLLVVMSSNFISLNILEGLIWFVLPISLVICNDICAYITGRLFGKHKLIKLSPKKTWEGFIGGLILTLIFGVYFSSFLAKYDYMICPLKNNITANFFNAPRCKPNLVFVERTFVLTKYKVYSFLQHYIIDLPNQIRLPPIVLHSLVFSAFASLIAPFGGFFSSGLKRAFKIKDFSNTIPGHGGFTDRMDCQFFMALFAYLYYTSFIKNRYHMNASALVIFQQISNITDQKILVDLYYLLKDKLCSNNLLHQIECNNSIVSNNI